MSGHAPAIDKLLASDEPAIRYKMLTRVLGEPADSARARSLCEKIRGDTLASTRPRTTV